MAIALSFLIGSAVFLVVLALIGYLSKNLWVVFGCVLLLTIIGTYYYYRRRDMCYVWGLSEQATSTFSTGGST